MIWSLIADACASSPSCLDPPVVAGGPGGATERVLRVEANLNIASGALNPFSDDIS